MSDQRSSDSDQLKRDIPSFIEPRPPLILNPFMRPRPQKGTNLLELFDEDSESEEPEWVQVYLRLKPCNVRNNLYEVRSDRCLITSVDTATMGHGRRTQHNVSKMYTFSHIFGPDCDQKQIFEQVVKENLKKLPEGHNFTLLTYGASGSGKTYTLMGTVQAPGLVPRSLEYVFRVVDAAQQPLYKPTDGGAEKISCYSQDYELQFVNKLRQISAPLRDKYRRMSAQLRRDLTTSTLDLSNRTRYYVWVSFVEIYNEAIYDLLSHSDRSKATSKLRIREDSNGNVYVKGATQAFVRSGEEAYDVLVAGKHNLQVAATGVHANSSRSHCIFTITMLTETDDGVRTSCVRLCDLAGCERARQTRNTGARMQESRAINSSLHVLERCLHMLRRKQKQKIDSTLVPYRESKLTRLLGAGLSGSRGEAVSMVVTLNPAPQFQHETRHVLQLAAVAKDIQVNQTIAESTISLETSQDTTVECSAQILKLRSDNERLHFELVQAQTRNKELIAAMEEKQQEVAKTMFEIVEEAKDMTRQYYEAQMEALRSEMEEMQEEYENKLKSVSVSEGGTGTGTPARHLQRKVAELMTDIAILEEKLTAEKLARARAEEEVQHLRACIDERDEKARDDSAENNDDVMSVDSESEEEDDDQYNESLEPTFKKEDINKSRLLQQSILNDSKHTSDNNSLNESIKSDDKSINDSIKSNDTLKDDTVKDSTGEESYMTKSSDTQDGTANASQIDTFVVDRVTYTEESGRRSNSAMVRGTYVVMDEILNNVELDKSVPEKVKKSNSHTDTSVNRVTDTEESGIISNSAMVRGTYVVMDEIIDDVEPEKTVPEEIKKSLNAIERIRHSLNDMQNNLVENLTEQLTDRITAAINKSVKAKFDSDVSLAQFEQLELASKSDNPNEKRSNVTPDNDNIKFLKVNRHYFDVGNNENDLLPKLKKDKPYFDSIDVNVDANKKLAEVKNMLNEDRSPSIVKEDVGTNFEPSMIKKLLGDSFSKHADVVQTVYKTVPPKKHVSVDIFEGFESPRVVREPGTPKIVEEKISLGNSSHKRFSSEVLTLNSEASTTGLVDISPKKKINEVSVTVKNNKEMNTTFETLKLPKTSILEKCVEKFAIPLKVDIVEETRKSIEKLVFKQALDSQIVNEAKIKLERLSNDDKNENTALNSESQVGIQINSQNNTFEDFENLYKDITAPRATEFELLVSHSQANITNVNETADFEEKKYKTDIEKPKYNLRHTKNNISMEKKDVSIDKTDKTIDKKTGANKKDTSHSKDVDKVNDKFTTGKEFEKLENCLESEAKCEGKAKPRRNLRLRKRKNEGSIEDDKKLKDIVNLQKEFSDVTMDVPAPSKEVSKDIESPENVGEDENLPPLLGIQSCPSKSVTRSRRKLFTPRAEPLEESMAQSGGSNERVRVPRPSYHRTRARRKL